VVETGHDLVQRQLSFGIQDMQDLRRLEETRQVDIACSCISTHTIPRISIRRMLV
jgi:hypothetical protein